MKEKLIGNQYKKTSRVASLFGYNTWNELIDNLPLFNSFKIDFNKIPTFWRWISFSTWNLFFIIFFIALIQNGYTRNRTTTFLSTSSSSGECNIIEIPTTVTGSFAISDATGSNSIGLWSTNNKYNPNLGRYLVSVNALTYTPKQWKLNMHSVKQKLLKLSSKTVHRDFAWSIIAMNSFKYIRREKNGGSMEFKLSASPKYTFNKDYPAFGIGNANGVINSNIASSCKLDMSISYDESTATLTLSAQLGNGTTCFDGTSPPCKVIDPKCSSMITPQSLGYDEKNSQTTSLDLDYNMYAVTTAVAVNYGMISLKSLQVKNGDLQRKQLLVK